MDRISLLPDCLLHEILSFLNSKSVVQTCVLSKRWKTLWTDIPTLNFDFDSYSFEDSARNAPNSNGSPIKRFICRFLSEHRSKFIKKLSFSSSIHIDDAVLIVDLLLCYARHHTVQETCLNTCNTVHDAWPFGLLSCSSLTVLKMKLTFMDWFLSMHFPSLRILEFEYEWDHWFDIIIDQTGYFSGCPNLESLVLVNYLGEKLSVSAPKLENLELSACFSRWGLSFPQVELLTPSLKSVKFSNVLPTFKTASEFLCIHEVNIDIVDSDFGGDDPTLQELKESFSQLLRVFHNARTFTLPFKAMEVLLSVPYSLRGVPFHNLRYLKLKTEATDQMTSLSTSTLMNSIDCPNLEKLELIC